MFLVKLTEEFYRRSPQFYGVVINQEFLFTKYRFKVKSLIGLNSAEKIVLISEGNVLYIKELGNTSSQDVFHILNSKKCQWVSEAILTCQKLDYIDS